MMDGAIARRLIDAMHAGSGVVCAVGAGGKKSTLRRLSQAAERLGLTPVGMTATVMVAPFSDEASRPVVVEPPDRLEGRLNALLTGKIRTIAYACPSAKPGRLAGVPADLVRRLHATRGFRLTLVKADGARMRLIKAPNPGEPVLPPDPDVILPVVSVHAVGRPLDERIAHRVERLAAITGRTPGDILRPEDLATLLAHPEGALQRAGGATVVPVINAVDDPVRRQAAREAASGALDRTERFDRVVLATMIGPDPLVEVIERG